MRKSEWFLVIAVVAFFVTGLLFYPNLPIEVVSHWNAAGVANGHLPRFWGAFLLPIIFVILAALFFAIPRMDPKRDNIAKFRHYFDGSVIAFTIFFYYIYILTLLPNVGYQFDVTTFLIPALAVLFYVIGVVLPHTHPNWFFGIRTPWTMSSETVWHQTHKVGGLVFKISAVISLFGMFFSPSIAIWFLLVPILASALGLVIYSYVLYEGERR
jgi:uncharacterized membrane protein